MKIITAILDNGCIVMGITVIVLKILDWYNPFMDFMGHSEFVLYALCGFAIGAGLLHTLLKSKKRNTITIIPQEQGTQNGQN